MSDTAAFRAAYTRLATVADGKLVVGETLNDIHRLYDLVTKLPALGDSSLGSTNERAWLDSTRQTLELLYNKRLTALADTQRLQADVVSWIKKGVQDTASCGARLGDATSKSFLSRAASVTAEVASDFAEGVKKTAKAELHVVKKTVETAGEVTSSVVASTLKGFWPILLIAGVVLYAAYTGRKAIAGAL